MPPPPSLPSAPPAESSAALIIDVGGVKVPPVSASDTFHVKAKCLWCGGRFRLIFDAQWICETPACAAIQIANAVLAVEPHPDESPFLFLPLPLQVKIEHHPVKRLLVHGAAGISKSYGGRWYAYKRCLQIPGFRALLLRNTYDELMKNHLQYIETDVEHLKRGTKWIKSGMEAKQLWFPHKNDEKAILFMGYCADLGDIKQHVGPEWDLVLLEEGVTLLTKAISEISARDRGAATSRRARRKIGLSGQTRILTNPGGRAMNYLNDMYIAKNPDHEEFHKYKPEWYDHLAGSIIDNPYLEPDFEESNFGHLDDVRHAQLVSGRWDVFEGQFFTSFDPSRHVTDKP